MASTALLTRLLASWPPIFDRLPGVSPPRIYSPSLGKKLRLLVPMNVLVLCWLFAAEILIRGMVAIIVSSLIVLPRVFLKD